MSLGRACLAPWIATPRAARWLVVIILVLVLVGDVLGQVFGRAAQPWLFSAMLLGIGNGLCWTALMPNGLLLAIDAKRLALPGVGRDVAWSLPLYALLTIGVPMLLRLPYGHVLAFGIVQMLVATIAALYMLLPAYLALLICLMPLLHGALRHLVALPAPTDPCFLPWGGVTAVLLMLIVVWRWRQLLRGDVPPRGMRAPNVINLRRQLGMSRGDPVTGAPSLRTRPGWMVARPNLHGVGPYAPIRSLRMALGGAYLPQTITGRLYQLSINVLLLLLMGLLFFSVTIDDHSARRLAHYLFSHQGLIVIGWALAVGCLGVVMMPVELLILRWERINAELPLLALLPGISRHGAIKRELLRTALLQPAIWLGLLLLVSDIGAGLLHLGWPVEQAMLLMVLVCLGYLVAMALSIFGGRPLSGLGKALLMIGMFVLLCLSVLLLALQGDWAARHVITAAAALAAGWCSLVLFLLWLGFRGWRGLQARPHPFLPN